MNIPGLLNNLRLNVKIALLGAASVLFAALTMVGLAVWQSGQYNKLAQGEVDQLIDADLDHIAQGVYNLVMTENEAFQHQVDYNLRVARKMVKNAGNIHFSPKTITWTAVNQFTSEKVKVTLPKAYIGNRWLTQNSNPGIETPLIDEISELVGDNFTVFQRMNEKGDMLRVATTVRGNDGKRGIGTFIPAVNPDGKPNPVIAAVMAGNVFKGRAYVVNQWYLSKYDPIKDADGRVTGMIFGGVRLKQIEARLRQAIIQTRVGKTGYVWVLNGKGLGRGSYVISQGGHRDGENIWDVRDGNGRYTVQALIDMAVKLKPGELGTDRYLWKNPEDAVERSKIVRLAYFEPWDWVIGVGTYEDELQAYRALLSDGRRQMVTIMGGAGIIITVLMGVIGVLLSRTIVRPVRMMRMAVDEIVGGNLDQRVEVQSSDDIGMLADAFNHMTERLKATIEGLKQSENKYRSIYENSAEGIFQTTLDGSYISANPSMARILGYGSSEELIAEVRDLGRQIYVHPEDRERFLQVLKKQKSVYGREFQVYRRDGQVAWLSCSARLISDQDGTPLMIEGFNVDITPRKELEKALSESRNYLEKIINTIGDPIFVKDSEHRWITLNDAYCSFMGYEREELIGKTDTEFFPEEETAAFWEKDLQVLETGEEVTCEENFTDRSGVQHIVLTKKTLYTDEAGNRFVVGIITDLTELKRLEEQLRQSQKMETVGLLAGGISHDFNNLLTPILGYSELLLHEFGEGDPRGEKLRQIRHAAERARDLTRQLLAFSRKQVMELKVLDLGELVLRFQKMLRSTIRESIDIELTAASDLCPVRADVGQIEQVLMNLSVNAQDAMPDGGKLVISVSNVLLDRFAIAGKPDLVPGAYVQIAVEDSGVGMDAELVRHIFEPFFTTKELGKGTGLGLSMVYGIIKQHGGTVTVYSEQGRGSVFHVYLPCVMLGGIDLEGADVLDEQVPQGRETVLVVEDNEMVRMLTCEMLKGLGYSVLEAASPAQGIEMVKGHSREISLLLSDVIMPDMNGMDMYRMMRSFLPELKILFMSGYTSDVIAHHGVLDEGLHFIQKPFTLNDLSHKVRHVLDT